MGLRVGGAVAAGALRVEYSGSVANGRGVASEDVVAFQDPNPAKAVAAWVGLGFKRWPWLKVGGTAYLDTIPARPGDPARESELDERILGGFVAFSRSGAEVLAEAFDIRHEDHHAGASFVTTGMYVQGAWVFGRLKPYYRFDRVDRDEDDPYFRESVRDLSKHTAGLRIDVWDLVAAKLEVSLTDPRVGEGYTAAAVQVAFTF